MQKSDPNSTNQVPARRFTDSVQSYPTVIGPSITIRGELAGSDPIDVAGSVEGDSAVEAHFRVRDGARVSGRVAAASLEIRGAVKAPALEAERIEIGPSARVEATLRARIVAIAEGAVFDGEVHMRSGEAESAPTVFKEQRKPRDPEAAS